MHQRPNAERASKGSREVRAKQCPLPNCNHDETLEHLFITQKKYGLTYKLLDPPSQLIAAQSFMDSFKTTLYSKTDSATGHLNRCNKNLENKDENHHQSNVHQQFASIQTNRNRTQTKEMTGHTQTYKQHHWDFLNL